jgi:succinate dehydrogenase/fumarate reductase-like Fe-S protein
MDLDPITRAVKEIDQMAVNLEALKAVIADLAVDAEAAIAKLAELEAENTKLKEGESTENPAEQDEVNELATSATSTDEKLKGAVPPAAS